MQILLHEPFPSINQQHDHARGVDSRQRFHDAELFDRVAHLATAPHAGRIDQGVALTIALVGNENAIPGGAGLVEDHYPLFPEHAIDERRLTDVGTAHHADHKPPGRLFLFRQRLGKQVTNSVFQSA